jgi:hypothetical protein
MEKILVTQSVAIMYKVQTDGVLRDDFFNGLGYCV